MDTINSAIENVIDACETISEMTLKKLATLAISFIANIYATLFSWIKGHILRLFWSIQDCLLAYFKPFFLEYYDRIETKTVLIIILRSILKITMISFDVLRKVLNITAVALAELSAEGKPQIEKVKENLVRTESRTFQTVHSERNRKLNGNSSKNATDYHPPLISRSQSCRNSSYSWLSWNTK